MIKRPRFERMLRRLISMTVFLLVFAATAHAQDDTFREKFTRAYLENGFAQTTTLVKKNKAVIPPTVKAMVKEALEGEKTFNERMQILDVASAMATMYRYWHEDESPLREVEAAQRSEIEKENARLAGIEKWAKFDRYPGNRLLRASQAALDAAGAAPVVYPHWVHRLWYECGACHDGVFPMKMPESPMTHAMLDAGKLCGACHNGVASFDTKTKDDCKRCHLAGLPGDDAVSAPSRMELTKVTGTARRLMPGAKIPDAGAGNIPVDKLGAIDWAELAKTVNFEKIKAIGPDAKTEHRENVILFEPTMAGINKVPFSHKTHTKETACSSCHTGIFKDGLGANQISMKEMGESKYCGACHGKVAFGFSNCKKCHSMKPGEPVDGGYLPRH